MRAIDVETPPAKSSSATEPSAAATTPRTAKSAATSESSSLLAGIVKALLHFVSAHRIERIGSVARNRHRFCCTARCNPRNRHAGGRYVGHRTAPRTTGCILPRFTLKHGKILEATSAQIRTTLLVFLFVVVVACLVRPRQQHHFKIRLRALMGCVEHHLLRASGKCRHLYPQRVVPIGGNPQRVTAVHIRRSIDLFLGGRVRRGNSSTGNWHIPRLHDAMNREPSNRWRNRLPPQQMRVKHEDMKQEKELEDELRAQPALDHQKAKTGTPHSIAHIRYCLARIIPLSPTLNCRVLLLRNR